MTRVKRIALWNPERGAVDHVHVPVDAFGRVLDVSDEDTASRAAAEKPDETQAAIAIARAWLGKAGFHEDPAGEEPARIEIQGSGWEGRSHEHYVDVRVYVPALDIDHVVDGTHPDGITVEDA